MRAEPVNDLELDAYLDGELDLERQWAVEDHLARRPEAAARFVGELRARTSLRLLTARIDEAPHAVLQSASRLSRRLSAVSRKRWRPPFRATVAGGIAASLLLIAFVFGRSSVPMPPDYVTDAVMSYQTGILRAAMRSQIESPTFDEGETRRSTHIRVPDLPSGWTITDAQIFPSDEGPALQLMIRTPNARELSLFAIRAESRGPRSPTTIRQGKASVAYWSNLGMSYALTGTDDPATLDLAAEDLADNITS